MSRLKESERVVAAIVNPPELKFKSGLSEPERKAIYQRFETDELAPLLASWEELKINQVFADAGALFEKLLASFRSGYLAVEKPAFILPTVVGRTIIIKKNEDKGAIISHLDLSPFEDDLPLTFLWGGGFWFAEQPIGETVTEESLAKVLEGLEVDPNAIVGPCLSGMIRGSIAVEPPARDDEIVTFLGVTLARTLIEVEFYGSNKTICIPPSELDPINFREMIDFGLADSIMELGKRVGCYIER